MRSYMAVTEKPTPTETYINTFQQKKLMLNRLNKKNMFSFFFTIIKCNLSLISEECSPCIPTTTDPSRSFFSTHTCICRLAKDLQGYTWYTKVLRWLQRDTLHNYRSSFQCCHKESLSVTKDGTRATSANNAYFNTLRLRQDGHHYPDDIF